MKSLEHFRLAERRSQNLRQLLLRAHREINAAVAVELLRRGYDDIRLVHGRLLENLDRDGNSITVVAKRAQMTKQAMGSLAKELEQKGYLRRVLDENDRRAWLLKFTARGWRLMLTTFEIVAAIESRMSAQLGAERFQAFRSSLAAVPQSARDVETGHKARTKSALTKGNASRRRGALLYARPVSRT